MKKQLSLVAVLIAATAALPACATKNYVKKSVADVDTQVDALSRQVDENREKTRVMDGRLSEVDKTAQAAQTSADRAHSAATAAESKADAAALKADAVDKASKRLVYTVVLSEDQGNFAFGKAALPEA